MTVLAAACLIGFAVDDAAAVQVKQGTFTTGTATGNVNITGVGFQPKAVIFYWVRATAYDTSQAFNRTGYGFATSSPSIVNRGTAYAANDNITTSVTGYRRSETYSIIILSAGTPTLSGQASVTAFGSDGFTLNWQSAPTSNSIIHYIALGGSDLSAQAGTLTLTTGAGNDSVTGLAFQPNFLMLMSNYTGAVDALNQTAAMFSLGFASSTTARGATTITIRDADASATNPVSQQRTNAVLLGLLPTADPPTQDYIADLASFNADGFSLSKSDAPAANTPVFYLAMNATAGFEVGAFNRVTAPGTQTVTTTAEPKFAFLQSFNKAATTAIGAQGEISMGSGDGASQGAIWNEYQDPGTDDANSWTTASNVIISRTGTATNEAAATLTGFLSNGFSLNWSAANATAMQYLYWTVNREAVFSYSASNYNQAEGNSGTATVTITVNRAGNTSGTNTVQYATADGSARTSDNDYVAASGTLTFNPTVTSQTFTVTINGDAKDENNETVNLSLSNPDGSVGSPGAATITITNDDTAPNISFNAATSTGSELEGRVVLPVSLSQASGRTVAVTYNTTNGSATAPGDYTAVTNGTLMFLAGETTKYIRIVIANDGAGDPGENFTVTLSSPVNANLVTPWTNTVTTSEKYGSANNDCSSCHTYPPTDGTRSGATGAVQGSHASHTPLCATCHVTPATMTSADFMHRNGNIEMKSGATAIDGGYYNQDGVAGYSAADATFAQRNNPTTQTCITVNCHGGVTTPQWGVGTIDCTGCHNVTMGPRRAVTAEFGMTWNHGALNKFSCGVCHMEGAVSGSQTTGKTDPTYHGNGTIELRDPNTGTTMQGVTWSGPNAGSYASTGSPLSFVQFSRDLNSATLEAPVAAITINHCLHCHDAGGSVVYAQGGSATNPFATGVAPLDVDSQFNTANASYHPVKGKQNNSYIDQDTMEAPWNQSPKTPATNTQWGDLMSCFDCHAANNASGTQTSTVVAHGGNTTLRALYDAVNAQPTKLCVVCHKTSVYWTTSIHSATETSPGNGVSGFAYATDPDGYLGYHLLNEGYYFGCTVCHGTTGNFTTMTPSMPARPEGATNAHGFNTPNWPSGTRPYSFIRYATFVDNVKWTDWATGASAGCNGSNMCNDGRGPYTYGPGGTY